MLLISCHIFYTCHFLLGFMSANTLEVDMGNNCMYPKVLSLYETVISICLYPKVLSLLWTRIFQLAFPLDGRDSLFVCVGKPFKKRFGVATYFCFILKGKNKIRKKNPKYDS